MAKVNGAQSVETIPGRKIVLFSLFLILGLVCSQSLPIAFGIEKFNAAKPALDVMLYVCLAFIMINVGREFELDKSRWRSYTADYFIAMVTAAAPWLLICFYYMWLLPDDLFTSWDAWKENLLLSRFAAPTSAGILFTMLASAGLKNSWVYQKTRVLAIFDDLDTILLMIPLQIFMIGWRWQLAVVAVVVFGCLWFGWTRLDRFKMQQDWSSILGYATLMVFFCQGLYVFSSRLFGHDAAIHIEVLLPAFVLGMVMKHGHGSSKADDRAATVISLFFMLLVGMSMPLINLEADPLQSASVIASLPMPSWGTIALHVIMVSLLSNIGKLTPMLFYRDRSLKERLALSVGMFTRGEVGAGVIFIALGYHIGGPILLISVLTLVFNLILTGGFVIIVKRLVIKAEKKAALAASAAA